MLDLEARLALDRDDIHGAISALRNLLDRAPDHVDARLRLAHALIRDERRTEASAALESVQARRDLPTVQAVQLASLLAATGAADPAIEIAYQVLRDAPENPTYQAAAVNTFLTVAPKATGLGRTEVVPDTWVRLAAETGAAEDISYLILSEGPADIQHGEILADDPLADRLLGLRLGNRVVLHEGMATERAYRVAELKSAKLHVFHTAMAAFPERFPERTDLQRVRVGSGDAFDPTELIAALYKGREAGETAVRLYREKHLPVGVLARSDNELRRVYVWLLHNPEMPIFVESPGDDEIQSSIRAALNAGEVVITTTALSTLAELGALDLLSGTGAHLIAPRSLTEELVAEISEWEEALRRGSYTQMGVSDAGFQVTEYGPDLIERERSAAVALYEWVREHSEIRPRPLTGHDDRGTMLRDTIGASSYDAVLLAAEGRSLYADDEGLRELAAVGYRVDSFSSYALIHAAKTQGRVDDTLLHRNVARLFTLGHVALPVNPALILFALADAGYQVDSTVRCLLDRLADPTITLESAVAVVVQLLRELALTPLAGGALPAVTTMALERLSAHRDLDQTVTLFRKMARVAFKLLPFSYRVVEEKTELFVVARRRE
jgi:hypothetical protein